MKITEADLPETRYIQEGYFGAEIEPVKILETEFGKIYIGRLKDEFVFYDENGEDPMKLSSIDIEDFETALEVNKRRKRLKDVFIDNN
jgi:hypothetical protein